MCINAESELEAVGMAWGALATGARAATGSTGQGLSLMQESFSEITLAELPLVIFNMARGQQDYYQATRGGGHGDYRHIVLAPDGHRRGGRAHPARVPPRRQVAQPRARLRRLPARAHPGGGRRSTPIDVRRPLPAKDWAVDGSLGGSAAGRGSSRRSASARPASRVAGHRAATCAAIADKLAADGGEPRCGSRPATSTTPRPWSSRSARPASSCATSSQQLRAEGEKIGYVRPITLWPFPYEAVARARPRARDASACSSCAPAR